VSGPQRLLARYTRHLPPGELVWIGLRPRRRAPMMAVPAVDALAGLGLAGDHRCGKTPGSARQVTLISEEYIGQIAHFTGRGDVAPELLRRNLVLRGINLTALRHQRFAIGGALFEATALCHPCARMEEALGEGGVAAMLGHGGLCARILQGGRIALGDAVTLCPDPEEGAPR
jgi:MOSC domain-containing protein YiiM